MVTDRGLVGLGNAGESYDDFGQGRHYEDLQPGRVRRARAGEGARLRGHRHLGDVPGPRPEARRHRGPRARGVVVPRSTTTGSPSGARSAPDRLKGVGALPMQDPGRSGREAHRIQDRRARRRRSSARTRTTACRSTTRSYTPVWEALEETGLTLGLHITGLADMPGALAAMGAPDGAGDAPRADPGDRPDGDAVEPRLRRRARAAPRPQGRGARERWRVDRALDGPAQRVRGELPLGRGADDARPPRSTSSGSAGSASIPGERTPGALGPIAGADRFIWASDFPHNDAKYPGVVDELREHNDDLPEADRRALYGLNVACGPDLV